MRERVEDALNVLALSLGIAVVRLGEWPMGAALIVVAALNVGINAVERDEEVRRAVRRMEEEQARTAEEQGP